MESNKPVIVGGASAAAFIALFQSFIALGRVSGWWQMDEEVVEAWVDFLQIAIPIAAIALTTWWTATRTTSLEKPEDEDGMPLVRADTKAETISETRSIENAIKRGFK